MKKLIYTIIAVLFLMSGQVWAQNKLDELIEAMAGEEEYKKFKCEESGKKNCNGNRKKRKLHSKRKLEECDYYQHIVECSEILEGDYPKVEKSHINKAKRVCTYKPDEIDRIYEKATQIHTLLNKGRLQIKIVKRSGSSEIFFEHSEHKEIPFFYYTMLGKRDYVPQCAERENIGYGYSFFVLRRYQFIVFESGCEYSAHSHAYPEDNYGYPYLENCAVVLGEYDAENKKTEYQLFNNVAFGDEGTVAVKKGKDKIVGAPDLIKYKAKDLKAVYFCNPPDDFTIDFEDSELVGLFNSKNEKVAGAIARENELANEKELGEILMAGLYIGGLLVVMFLFVYLYHLNQNHKWVSAIVGFVSGLFGGAFKPAYDAVEGNSGTQTADESWRAEEEAERVREEEAKRQREAESASKTQTEFDPKWESEETTKEPQYGTVEWAFEELEIEPDYPITEDFVDSCSKHCRKKWHPDKFSNEEEFSPERRKTADVKFKNIAVAEDVLKKHIRANSN